MEAIGAIVLAAGSSSRLGRPKQFLVHEGQTLLRRTVEVALQGGCVPVVIVAGSDVAAVKQEVAGLALEVVAHAEWARGMGSSIRAGVARALALVPDLEGLMILVCDQPFVTAALLAEMMATRARQRRGIVACRYAQTLGVPVFFDRPYFPQLAALPDEHGAKQLLARHADDVATVDFPAGEIDIDTLADCATHLTVEMSHG